MFRYGLAPVLVILLAATLHFGQTPIKKARVPVVAKDKKHAAKSDKKDPTARELLRCLEEKIEVKPYQSGMTLKEVLKKFTETFAAKGKELPLFVDTQAFLEENPDAPDVYDTLVKFLPVPRRMTFERALRVTLSKIRTDNAAFLVRRGCIEITTLGEQRRAGFCKSGSWRTLRRGPWPKL